MSDQLGPALQALRETSQELLRAVESNDPAATEQALSQRNAAFERGAALAARGPADLAPELRALFSDDLTEQRRKLMSALKIAVKGLDDPAQLMPVIRELGKIHKTYGVVDDDYDTVGEALLWTLGQGLGDAFTLEVADAWLAVYGLLSRVMREAAVEA